MISPTPQFSVIIPCYNSARWIRRCLDSVFIQADNDYEVIAVDDGSTDDTRAVLDAYGHNIKVLSQANQGAGVARNLAIGHATGITLPLWTRMISGFPGRWQRFGN